MDRRQPLKRLELLPASGDQLARRVRESIFERRCECKALERRFFRSCERRRNDLDRRGRRSAQEQILEAHCPPREDLFVDRYRTKRVHLDARQAERAHLPERHQQLRWEARDELQCDVLQSRQSKYRSDRTAQVRGEILLRCQVRIERKRERLDARKEAERRGERFRRRDPGVVHTEILLAAVAEVQATHVFADVRARTE